MEKAFSNIASFASIISLLLTIKIFFKLRNILGMRKYYEKLLKAGTIENNFYKVGLNMSIDVYATPAEIISKLRDTLKGYKNIVDKMDKYMDENCKKELWDERKLGLNNHTQRVELLISQLEINVLELELLNTQNPLPHNLNIIKDKQEKLLALARKTSYID